MFAHMDLSVLPPPCPCGLLDCQNWTCFFLKKQLRPFHHCGSRIFQAGPFKAICNSAGSGLARFSYFWYPTGCLPNSQFEESHIPPS